MEVAASQGVPPDWFLDKPPFWYDWAVIRYNVKAELSTPPDVVE